MRFPPQSHQGHGDRDVDLTLHLSDTPGISNAPVVRPMRYSGHSFETSSGRYFANLYCQLSSDPTTTMNALDCHNSAGHRSTLQWPTHCRCNGNPWGFDCRTGLPLAYRGQGAEAKVPSRGQRHCRARPPTHVKHRCHAPASWGGKNWCRHAPPLVAR